MAHTTPPAFSPAQQATAKEMGLDLGNIDWSWVASIFEFVAKLIRGSFTPTPMNLHPAETAAAQRLGIDPAHLDWKKLGGWLTFLLDLLGKFSSPAPATAPAPKP